MNTSIQELMSSDRPYLTDGGLETSMIFHEGFDLPHFAAFPLLKTEAGRTALKAYYERFLGIAEQSGRGFVLDTPTWRAGMAWTGHFEFSDAEMAEVNKDAVAWCQALRDTWAERVGSIVINGQVGPAGDAYEVDQALSEQDALEVHRGQLKALAEAGADLASAMTLGAASEAIGIARAAKSVDIPLVIAFTTETDGNLPNGQALNDAIAEVDAATDASPLFYMINCAHPDHFKTRLTGNGWLERIGGVRANASRQSHAELDACTVLDDGNPAEFGDLNAALSQMLPSLRVLGGCCGTDHRHVGEVAAKEGVAA